MASRKAAAERNKRRRKRYYRHIWFFTCRQCGKQKRRSHSKARAEAGACGTCRRGVDENPNQMQICER